MKVGDRIKVDNWPTAMTVMTLPKTNDPYEEMELCIKKYNRTVRVQQGHIRNGEIKYVEA